MSEAAAAAGLFLSPSQAQAFAAQEHVTPRLSLGIHTVEPGDRIAPEVLKAYAVVVIEVDPAEPQSVDRLIGVMRAHPALQVIAAIANPDVSLIRTVMKSGVADVIALPLDVEQLVTVVLGAETRNAIPLTEIRLAPLVAVIRSSGGCGATTVATHLASDLAGRDRQGKGALLVDLDLQFGSVAAYLDVQKGGAITNLMAASSRIDAFLLKSVVAETGGGLNVLGVPGEILPLEAVDIDGILKAMEQLRRQFGVVVADFPAGWSNWAASMAYGADLVLLVIEPSLNSIRQARRTLDLLNTLGVPASKIRLVVNKIEKSFFRSIQPRDIAETLGCEILESLPADGDVLTKAQEQGQLAAAISRRSPFAAASRKLAEAVEAILLSGE